MKPFKVGIDSYSLKSLNLSPFEILDWAIMNDAEGVQFSDGYVAPDGTADRVFLRELAGYAEENHLYLEWGGGEYIPLDSATGKPKDILAVNRKAAEQARLLGATCFRSGSGGLRRWDHKSPPIEDILRLTAKSLKEQQPMLQDFGVVLALETQLAFSSFDFLRLFDMCGFRPGEHLGICLDTMNFLAMVEDPVAATKRLLPWIVMTHLKDGAVLLSEDGLTAFPAEAGTGIVDLPSVIEKLAATERRINLSLEDHAGMFHVPFFDREFLAKLPDLTAAEMAGLVKLSLKSRAYLDDGRVAILNQDRWPEHCERRIKRGLRAVRKMIEKR